MRNIKSKLLGTYYTLRTEVNRLESSPDKASAYKFLRFVGPIILNAYANYEICLTIRSPVTHTLPAEFWTLKNPISVTGVISHFYTDRF
jgi:hypothetical protein